ncbi:unnamed protein product [Trypanosoma congolense IL3000]|uniref:WGS project CAEQ00000000 data, annotated contig 678 n=1 Tax=Trypanosoma congolense (strain IL3000) TaxID=1068625 RepID=F9WHP4_TRYCI|nr:unnamed protein product [Trypanosoma congolense IL3000]
MRRCHLPGGAAAVVSGVRPGFAGGSAVGSLLRAAIGSRAHWFGSRRVSTFPARPRSTSTQSVPVPSQEERSLTRSAPRTKRPTRSALQESYCMHGVCAWELPFPAGNLRCFQIANFVYWGHVALLRTRSAFSSTALSTKIVRATGSVRGMG